MNRPVSSVVLRARARVQRAIEAHESQRLVALPAPGEATGALSNHIEVGASSARAKVALANLRDVIARRARKLGVTTKPADLVEPVEPSDQAAAIGFSQDDETPPEPGEDGAGDVFEAVEMPAALESAPGAPEASGALIDRPLNLDALDALLEGRDYTPAAHPMDQADTAEMEAQRAELADLQGEAAFLGAPLQGDAGEDVFEIPAEAFAEITGDAREQVDQAREDEAHQIEEELRRSADNAGGVVADFDDQINHLMSKF